MLVAQGPWPSRRRLPLRGADLVLMAMHSGWKRTGASNNAILVIHCEGRLDTEPMRRSLDRFLDVCPWPAARLRRPFPWGKLHWAAGPRATLTPPAVRRASAATPEALQALVEHELNGTIDPRTPVIVGVGQHNQRVDQGAEPLEPVDLIAEALRAADADAGVSGLSSAADLVAVVSLLSWRYGDPAALVASRVGAAPARTIATTPGGNSPQSLLNRVASDIADGACDVALLCGAEAWRTRMAARELGGRPDWTVQPEGTRPTEVFGTELEMSHPAEQARGLLMPVQMYPMFESALRAAAGRSVDEHNRLIAGLWSRFSEVAATNPHAWVPQAFSAAEIGTPTPDNRMIGFPYTKRMNSNNAVEQAAVVVLCSAERAGALGIPKERWVFPWAGADSHDTPFVSNRADLYSSPAIRAAGRAVLDLAGVGVDDLAHVDLYSCFPSAVGIAAAELGLGLDRPLTVTGGLSFAGGPWNNYVTHAIAAMTERLRADDGAIGLVTANGGFVTKHAFGVYSATPPARAFRSASPQEEIDRSPRREVAEDWDGPVTVEACTVMHSRAGEPETGLLAVLLADGRRAWGSTTEPDTLKRMVAEESVGRPAHLAADGTVEL